MTFRFCEAEIIVGENVGASSGSTSSATVLSTARARSTTAVAARHLAEHRLEERLDLLLDLRLRPVRRDPLDQPRRLHERVVGDSRHRRVARAPVHARS